MQPEAGFRGSGTRGSLGRPQLRRFGRKLLRIKLHLELDEIVVF
jgi:hypothetical protein